MGERMAVKTTGEIAEHGTFAASAPWSIVTEWQTVFLERSQELGTMEAGHGGGDEVGIKTVVEFPWDLVVKMSEKFASGGREDVIYGWC